VTQVRAAVIQMTSGDDLRRNLDTARHWLREAAGAGAQCAVLPENFAFMGAGARDKLVHREADGQGPIQDFLSRTAHDLQLTLVGGTVPLSVDGDDDRVWPASLVYGPDGGRIARYDKIHLFDVDLPPGADGKPAENYRESASFARGATHTVVADTPAGAVGLSVCYDLRFPELYRTLTDQGATLLSVPAAFTFRTGAAHWEILLRARAVENLCYVLASAQTGKHPGERETWGHSMIIDPWGTVLARCDDKPGYAIADIDEERVTSLRQSFPALTHRRLQAAT